MEYERIPRNSPFARQYIAIVESLSRLQKSRARGKVFGASAHGFETNPPLKECDVADFESQHGIALPEDYRGFLVHVGNGGAGPYYGVFRLGEMDDGWGHAPWEESNGFVGDLSEPFPHRDRWNDLTGKPEFDASRETDHDYEDEYGERLDEWEQNHYWHPRQVNGAIPICHLGCAYRQWLVITGPEAGHIWCDDRVDYRGLYPLELDDKRRASFIDWYLSWLDDAIKLSAKN